jgi:dihydrofolate reductase
MSTFRFQLAMSLDGFVAGPDQSEDHPLGVGGMELHQWVFPLEAWRRQQGLEGGEVNASTAVVEEAQAGVGATVMGRNMFGGGPGPWREDRPWNGWWGENPPFHTPVFVVTHHSREPLELAGGTAFFLSPMGRDRLRPGQAGRGRPGWASGRRRQRRSAVLAAGLVDEFEVHLAPVLLGAGERLLENVGDLKVEQVRAIEAPGVTHIKYRVVRAAGVAQAKRRGPIHLHLEVEPEPDWYGSGGSTGLGRLTASAS